MGASVHLPCMAVGGFLFVPLFSCLFNVYFFLLPAGHSDTHFSFGKGQCQRSVGRRGPAQRWLDFSRLTSDAASLSPCF